MPSQKRVNLEIQANLSHEMAKAALEQALDDAELMGNQLMIAVGLIGAIEKYLVPWPDNPLMPEKLVTRDLIPVLNLANQLNQSIHPNKSLEEAKESALKRYHQYFWASGNKEGEITS